jgi:hypothetical protein
VFPVFSRYIVILNLKPHDGTTLTSTLNLSVANVKKTHDLWRSRGAEFLTPSKDHATEIRCYLKDSDGTSINQRWVTAANCS